jgi:hypothetical protein
VKALFDLSERGLLFLGYRAPFNVHEVEQVVTVPRSHLMQTSTHCLRSFGLYKPYSSAAHFFVAALTSGSGEQDAAESAAMTASAPQIRMMQSNRSVPEFQH